MQTVTQCLANAAENRVHGQRPKALESFAIRADDWLKRGGSCKQGVTGEHGRLPIGSRLQCNKVLRTEGTYHQLPPISPNHLFFCLDSATTAPPLRRNLCSTRERRTRRLTTASLSPTPPSPCRQPAAACSDGRPPSRHGGLRRCGSIALPLTRFPSRQPAILRLLRSHPPSAPATGKSSLPLVTSTAACSDRQTTIR